MGGVCIAKDVLVRSRCTSSIAITVPMRRCRVSKDIRGRRRGADGIPIAVTMRGCRISKHVC